MAESCSSLATQLSVVISNYNLYNSGWSTTLSSGLSAAQSDNISAAKAAYSKVANSYDRLEGVQGRIDDILEKADDLNCTDVFNQASTYATRITETLDAIDEGLNNLEAAIGDAEDRIEETEAATQTEDNAGDGTPGSQPSNNPDPDQDDNDLVLDEEGDDPEDADELGDGLGEPEPIGDDEIDAELAAAEAEAAAALAAAETESLGLNDNTNQGLDGDITSAQAQATLQDTTNFEQQPDWRVRLSLSPGAWYLYKDPDNEILAPLRDTDGIIFPYTPTINVTYGANYQTSQPTHSNYKIFQYENSYVDTISITCDFTAQDTQEALYMLAVIHFLRSITKMFYGQDSAPKPGTPPPLCYLFGLGEFQFNAHPLAITSFTYNLPPDVDYIRAGALTEPPGVNRADQGASTKTSSTSLGSTIQDEIQNRLRSGIAAVGNALGLKLQPGGGSSGYVFGMSNRFNSPLPPGTIEPTYVPTKINISISAVPIISRYEISNNFSVKDYANGSLLQGTKRKGGGFW